MNYFEQYGGKRKVTKCQMGFERFLGKFAKSEGATRGKRASQPLFNPEAG